MARSRSHLWQGEHRITEICMGLEHKCRISLGNSISWTLINGLLIMLLMKIIPIRCINRRSYSQAQTYSRAPRGTGTRANGTRNPGRDPGQYVRTGQYVQCPGLPTSTVWQGLAPRWHGVQVNRSELKRPNRIHDIHVHICTCT